MPPTAVILFALTISALPLAPVAGMSAHDMARVAEVVLLAAMSFASVPALAIHSPPSWTGRTAVVGTLAAMIMGLAIASTARAVYPGAAAQEVALALGLCAATNGFRLMNARTTSIVGRLLALGALAYVALVLGIYLAAMLTHAPLDARRLAIGFDNPRFLNHAQTVAVPILVGIALTESRPFWRVTALLAATGHVAFAGLDLARATWLAWSVAAVALLLTQRRADRWLRSFSAVIVGGAALALLLFVLTPAIFGQAWQPSFASPAELGSSHSRDYLWRLAIQNIAAHPLLGVGPMQFAAEPNLKGAHPHDIYLQWAAEFGLPAAALLLVLLTLMMRAGCLRLRAQGATADPLLAGALAGVVAALVDGGFSGNFVMPVPQMWIALAFGLLIGRSQTAEPRHTHGAHLTWAAVSLTAVLAASQVLLLSMTGRQLLLDPPRIRVDSPRPTPGEPYRPRFWLNGWI